MHRLKVTQILYFPRIGNMGTITMNNLSFCCGDNETKNGKQEVSIHLFPLQSTDLHRSVHNLSCYRLPTTYCYSYSIQCKVSWFSLDQPSLVLSVKCFPCTAVDEDHSQSDPEGPATRVGNTLQRCGIKLAEISSILSL